MGLPSAVEILECQPAVCCSDHHENFFPHEPFVICGCSSTSHREHYMRPLLLVLCDP